MFLARRRRAGSNAARDTRVGIQEPWGTLYSFDRRQQNNVHYWTPNSNGWSLRVARGMGEERPANGARPALTSAALIRDNGAWYATLAHEDHHDYQGHGLSDRGSKLALA